jgi:hypothetical protein
LSHLAAGRCDLAEADCDSELRCWPDSNEGKECKAEVLISCKKEYDVALTYVRGLMADAKGRAADTSRVAWYHNAIGVALMRRGRAEDLAEACAEFATVLKVDLDNMDARANFKVCASRLMTSTSTVHASVPPPAPIQR